jgi:hypothetical protein
MLSAIPISPGIVLPQINTRYHFTGAVLPEQLAFYTHYGFLHFTGFLSALAVSELRSHIAHIAAKLIASNAKTVSGIPIKYGTAEDGERIIHRLPYTSHCNRDIELLLNHAGMHTFCSLLGREDARVGYNEKDGIVTNYYINSSNSNQRQMGWHTDSMREIMLLQRLEPMINVGLYLTDSGSHNGGLRVLPRSHTQGTAAMIFSKVQLLNKRPDKNEFLVNTQAGDLVLHSGRLWHWVGKSPLTGIKSMRQVMYVPIICGTQLHRHMNSSTPLYHKLNKYISYK